MVSFLRKTVSQEVVFRGKGLHSGLPVTARVHPGENGIVFIAGTNRTPAIPSNVTDTSRCTCLGEISTIEHIMSALAGLGITDSDIEVEGGELPALDGGSQVFYSGLVGAGLSPIGHRQIESLYTRIYHHDGDVKIAISQGDGHWRYELEYGDRWPGSQHFDVRLNSDAYGVEVAPARTYALEEEMEMVRKAGLGQGLDETSAVLIGKTGYVNEVKFLDEPARHKLLDLIGDLYLSGIPFHFLNVVASRSGHRTNVAAAKKLQDAVRVIEG